MIQMFLAYDVMLLNSLNHIEDCDSGFRRGKERDLLRRLASVHLPSNRILKDGRSHVVLAS